MPPWSTGQRLTLIAEQKVAVQFKISDVSAPRPVREDRTHSLLSLHSLSLLALSAEELKWSIQSIRPSEATKGMGKVTHIQEGIYIYRICIDKCRIYTYIGGSGCSLGVASMEQCSVAIFWVLAATAVFANEAALVFCPFSNSCITLGVSIFAKVPCTDTGFVCLNLLSITTALPSFPPELDCP